MILSPIQKHGAAKTSAQALCNGGGSSRKYLKTLIKKYRAQNAAPVRKPCFSLPKGTFWFRIRSKRRFLTTIIKQSSQSIPTVAILLFNALPTPEEMNILFSIHQTPHMDEATVHSPHFLSLQEKVEKNDWQEMLIRLCAVPAIECG